MSTPAAVCICCKKCADIMDENAELRAMNREQYRRLSFAFFLVVSQAVALIVLLARCAR